MFTLLLTTVSSLCCHADVIRPIETIPSDGMNLTVREQVDNNRAIITTIPPVHNWFYGQLANLPLQQLFTLGLQIDSTSDATNKPSVAKWDGLVPVMTYADPTQYSSYECYLRNSTGVWQTTDIFTIGAARDAGNGQLPLQHCIPEQLAHKFLTANGTAWIPWRAVDHVQAVPALNIFRIQQQYDMSTATIAMRIPFTYTYLQEVIKRIGDARLPGVSVVDIGLTPEQRKLQLISVTDDKSTSDNRDTKTILVIAREHATEHTTSWAIMGMLARLLSNSPEQSKLRENITWLLLPIEDPDGSAHAQFDRLTDAFRNTTTVSTKTPEVVSYVKYFADYYNAGRTIDAVVSLHNVEANEGVNVFCPIIDSRHPAAVKLFNDQYYALLKRHRYVAADANTETNDGFPTFRLYGWCADRFHAFNLAYEVNDRYPQRPLNLIELQHVGSLLADSLAAWAQSDAGNAWHTRALTLLQLHASERQYYLQHTPDTARNILYDLIQMAY